MPERRSLDENVRSLHRADVSWGHWTGGDGGELAAVRAGRGTRASAAVRTGRDTGALTATRADGDRRGVTAIRADAVDVFVGSASGGRNIEIPSAAVETTVSTPAYVPSQRRLRRGLRLVIGAGVGQFGGGGHAPYMSPLTMITVFPSPFTFAV
ncbi:MAG TPA: hypothetical protein VFS20_25185 [Longimicrobium sp.]|nr:hypothetical protein [Longimicrobium sp.]